MGRLWRQKQWPSTNTLQLETANSEGKGHNTGDGGKHVAHVCLHASMYVGMYVCVYACMYTVCMYVCM